MGLLGSLGFDQRNIIFSSDTSEEQGRQFGKGRGTVDCCYPVKCMSGHYGELVFGQRQKLDIILSPMIYNLPSFLSGHVAKALTCPRVMAAPENIKAGFLKEGDVFADNGIKYVTPFVSLDEPLLVPKQLFEGMHEAVPGLTREEMARAVLDKAAAAEIVAMAAAVSDYRPAEKAPNKIKKQDGGQRLELVRTEDILKSLAEAKGRRFLIGFAAETEKLLESARKKRAEKRIDLMVANDVSRNGSGFASEKNAAVLIDAKGETELPLMSKRELAERIWDRVAELRPRA